MRIKRIPERLQYAITCYVVGDGVSNGICFTMAADSADEPLPEESHSGCRGKALARRTLVGPVETTENVFVDAGKRVETGEPSEANDSGGGEGAYGMLEFVLIVGLVQGRGQKGLLLVQQNV